MRSSLLNRALAWMSALFTLMTLSSAAVAAAGGACAGAQADSAWCRESARREQILQSYLQGHADDLRSFSTASLGGRGFPYVFLRLLPDLFPDLAAQMGPNLARLGFSANPYDDRVTPLPLGLGYAPQTFSVAGIFPVSVPLQVATLTCGSCHIGQVTGPDHRPVQLVGAANSRFDSTGLFRLFKDIVEHPNFNEQAVRSAIESKPQGWFYADPSLAANEAVERWMYTTFTKQLIDTTRDSVRSGIADQDRMIAQQGYARSGALSYFSRTPGRADATALTMALFAGGDPEQMPRAPTITKIMSVWAQKDRAVSHWAADMSWGVQPVVAAELAVVGDAKVLNRDNIVRSTRFIENLPPPVYPFAVDTAKAARGRALFEDNCASCHKVGDTTVYAADDVGTDPSRLNAMTELTRRNFDRALHEGCPSPELACPNPLEPILRSYSAAQGYVATPLDGIWARAPYLHNGSVPTLFHLLVPRERPANFVVGGFDFDADKVGYDWQSPGPNTEVYVTGSPAQWNTGHDSKRYLGEIDWGTETDKREALLEYMKTL